MATIINKLLPIVLLIFILAFSCAANDTRKKQIQHWDEIVRIVAQPYNHSNCEGVIKKLKIDIVDWTKDMNGTTNSLRNFIDRCEPRIGQENEKVKPIFQYADKVLECMESGKSGSSNAMTIVAIVFIVAFIVALAGVVALAILHFRRTCGPIA